MDLSVQILSDVTVWNKYARHINDLGRRETYDEVCNRYEAMMIKRYPGIEQSIKEKMLYIRQRKVLPSMRGFQFAGPAIDKNESRIYNCAFLPLNDVKSFSETMFLLLGGTGVGFSVQTTHVSKLPTIKIPTQQQKFVVDDSIEGWADAVKYLMKSFLGQRKYEPRFDFSAIRPKGERLITAGGKAPGPEPLKRCLFNIRQILTRKSNGEQLTPLECYDIQCHIADAVLAGGIRRAAMICLFDRFDEEMITCKSGPWWENNPQRGRSNNSAVLPRGIVTKDEFMKLWKMIEFSGAGEPGIYWTNDINWGTNPCCEIALKPYQFCNLCEINAGAVSTQEELNEAVSAGSFFGTLQAGFTDFHYLRPIWKETTEEDALVGVGMTGICSGSVLNLDLEEAAKVACDVNEETAKVIGINKAARVTTVKPSGTSSCVLGSSSGIHAWHDDYYLRRMQLNSQEALVPFFLENHPELIAPYEAIPGSYVLEFPQKAPEGAILRNEESAIDFLNRTHKFNMEWVRQGHRSGANTNNVSATCSIKKLPKMKKNVFPVGDSSLKNLVETWTPETDSFGQTVYAINEWPEVGEWMWENREFYNGLSVLPYDGGTYRQAPFETISKEKYERLIKSLSSVDLTKVIENEDTTNHTQELACAGGACEIK